MHRIMTVYAWLLNNKYFTPIYNMIEYICVSVNCRWRNHFYPRCYCFWHWHDVLMRTGWKSVAPNSSTPCGVYATYSTDGVSSLVSRSPGEHLPLHRSTDVYGCSYQISVYLYIGQVYKTSITCSTWDLIPKTIFIMKKAQWFKDFGGIYYKEERGKLAIWTFIFLYLHKKHVK